VSRGSGPALGQFPLANLPPLGAPQWPSQAGSGAAGLVRGLFPLILPSSPPDVASLFPTIQPSPSPFPGTGGPANSLLPTIHPPARAAAADRPSVGTATGLPWTGLPLGGGQIAALFFLAAAALTSAAARLRTRWPSRASGASGPQVSPFPGAHSSPLPAAPSPMPTRTTAGKSSPAGLSHGGGRVARLIFLAAALALTAGAVRLWAQRRG
jgi:hypothetical protein